MGRRSRDEGMVSIDNGQPIVFAPAVPGLRKITMSLYFDDADPVARCHVPGCQWHAHGDSINDAVLAWTKHLTAVHRNDWPD